MVRSWHTEGIIHPSRIMQTEKKERGSVINDIHVNRTAPKVRMNAPVAG